MVDRDTDQAHEDQTGENDHLWVWTVTEMQRNERGHDSPVFEAVSGLKLSSNLKFYPSSGRGRLTHTAHIKAPILCAHTHIYTHTNEYIDKKQRLYDLVDTTENQILCLAQSTICFRLHHPVSLMPSLTIALPEGFVKSQLYTE